MAESGWSQFTPPASDVDALICSDFHLALTDEKPRASPIPTPAPRSALWPGCVRRNRPKSLPSKMLWSRSTALLTAQHVSPSIPIPSTSSPLKKTHRQEEGRETRAASRPKTIAVVQSADIQLFWSVLSTSFFWVIPSGSWASTAQRASRSNSRASHSILRSGL